MRLPCFAVPLAGLLALATALPAQKPDTLSAAQRAGLALARLGAGQRVRVHARGLGRAQGYIVSNSPNFLMLATDGSQIEIPAPSIDSLWVPGHSHAGRGAVMGGAIGGFTVAILVAGIHGQLCAQGPCGSDLGAFLAGFVYGAGGGAAIGAAVGLFVWEWQLRVP